MIDREDRGVEVVLAHWDRDTVAVELPVELWQGEDEKDVTEPLAAGETLAMPVRVPPPPPPVPEALREGLAEKVLNPPTPPTPPGVPVVRMGGLSVRVAELKGDTDTLPVGLPLKDTLGV